MAAGPADKVYVGDQGRIQPFNTGGECPADLPRHRRPADQEREGSGGWQRLPNGSLYVAREGRNGRTWRSSSASSGAKGMGRSDDNAARAPWRADASGENLRQEDRGGGTEARVELGCAQV